LNAGVRADEWMKMHTSNTYASESVGRPEFMILILITLNVFQNLAKTNKHVLYKVEKY